MKARFVETISGTDFDKLPWRIEWYRDPMHGEMVAQINGQDVHIQDEVTEKGTIDYARAEWRAIWELDQQQRKDCGCLDCMKGVREVGETSIVEVWHGQQESPA